MNQVLAIPEGQILDHGHGSWQLLAQETAGTTPTRLPEFLRAFSRHAGSLATDPFNAIDDNPFIAREWLVVSQVMHAAASTLEKRFELLFLGR
jgi:hypothetical protein